MDSTNEDFAVNSDDLNARVRYLTSVLEDYWVQLRERYSAVDNVGVPRSPVSRAVIVHDENHPHNLWSVVETWEGD